MLLDSDLSKLRPISNLHVKHRNPTANECWRGPIQHVPVANEQGGLHSLLQSKAAVFPEKHRKTGSCKVQETAGQSLSVTWWRRVTFTHQVLKSLFLSVLLHLCWVGLKEKEMDFSGDEHQAGRGYRRGLPQSSSTHAS